MGMSALVVGFRPADEEWKKMKAAWDACEAAGAQIPKKVLDFFDGENPGNKPGKEIRLGPAVTEWVDVGAGGFDVDVSKLPEGCRVVRFYNSW